LSKKEQAQLVRLRDKEKQLREDKKQLNKKEEQLNAQKILLLEEKKDLRQQQQAAAPSAGARAQCVFARAFSGLFVGGLLLLVLGVVWGFAAFFLLLGGGVAKTCFCRGRVV
jgi:hypothetical protein